VPAELVSTLVVELVMLELSDRVVPAPGLESPAGVDVELVADVVLAEVVPFDAAVPPCWLGPTTMKIEDALPR
jgi:hypothetical protein